MKLLDNDKFFHHHALVIGLNFDNMRFRICHNGSGGSCTAAFCAEILRGIIRIAQASVARRQRVMLR